MTFNEFPDVLIASKTSPEFPKAFKFLSKIFEKPYSLLHAVNVDVSVHKLNTGNGFLFFWT